jgi:hypothetical protein
MHVPTGQISPPRQFQAPAMARQPLFRTRGAGMALQAPCAIKTNLSAGSELFNPFLRGLLETTKRLYIGSRPQGGFGPFKATRHASDTMAPFLWSGHYG